MNTGLLYCCIVADTYAYLCAGQELGSSPNFSGLRPLRVSACSFAPLLGRYHMSGGIVTEHRSNGWRLAPVCCL